MLVSFELATAELGTAPRLQSVLPRTFSSSATDVTIAAPDATAEGRSPCRAAQEAGGFAVKDLSCGAQHETYEEQGATLWHVLAAAYAPPQH
jgi:hypothetical protein